MNDHSPLNRESFSFVQGVFQYLLNISTDMQKKYIFECAFIVNWWEWNFLLLSKIRVKLSHRKKIRKHLNIATIQNAEVALCMRGVVNSRASGPIFTTISEKYSIQGQKISYVITVSKWKIRISQEIF